MSTEVPEGWTVTTLEAAGAWCSGGTPSRKVPKYFQGEIPWVKSGDLNDGPIRSTAENISEEALAASSAKLLPAGTICMALYGATIGKLGILQIGAATNQACANCAPITTLTDTKYLFYYLLSQRREFIEKGQGGAQPNISQEIVRRHPLAIPPRKEQERIVAQLEALNEKTQTVQARLDNIPTIIKRFRQSILSSACNGLLTAGWRSVESNKHGPKKVNAESSAEHDTGWPITPPDGWRWATLRDTCARGRSICYGVIKLGPEHSEGVPCLRTSDVKWLRIEQEGVKLISPTISDEYRRTILRGGEVLVSVRGTLGGVAVVPPAMAGWNISREVAVVPVADVIPEYVALWIASNESQRWLTEVAKGVAYTGINIEDLKRLPILLPTFDEQREIVRRVKALMQIADRIEARHRLAGDQVEKLTQSVLAKAFRGELVPTEAELARREGRDYETAQQLLERITKETGKTTPPRRQVQR